MVFLVCVSTLFLAARKFYDQSNSVLLMQAKATNFFSFFFFARSICHYDLVDVAIAVIVIALNAIPFAI